MPKKPPKRRPPPPPSEEIEVDAASVPPAQPAKPAEGVTDEFADPFDDEVIIAPPAEDKVHAAGEAVRNAVGAARRKATRSDPGGKQQTGSRDAHAGIPSITTVSMDNRKLTKKQTEQLKDWRGANHGKQVDAYFSGQLQSARQKFGHNSVMVGTPEENLIVCIPTPSIAFEYLVGQSGFPLGLIMHLVGKAGSLKSAFLYELYRWFMLAGGGGHLEEAESKWSPELLRSVTRQKRGQNRVIVDRCNSVEEWQQRLLYNLEDNKKKLVGTKEEPGPGRTIPILLGVDSIMGKPSVNTQEKVNDQGHGSKMYPEEALIITQWMKTVPHQLDGWPFAIVLNNHLKLGSDGDGNEVRRTAGGVGVNFQESFELELSVAKSKLTCADWDGVQVRIRCAKNSYGPTHRQIDARMLWWEEDDPDSETGWVQRTMWDWHWSTIRLLTSDYLPGRLKTKLKEAGVHVKAEKTSDVENTAWSASLGMKAKDAIPWRDLGERIAKTPELVAKIRKALGIRERPYLAGDYLNQIEDLKELLP